LQGRENSFTRILHIFTEPILSPAKKLQNKFIPELPLDFSPFIAFIFIGILRTLVHSIF
jgi:YggT family protein